MEIRIEPFDPDGASDRTIEAYTDFANELNAEVRPEDPPRDPAAVRRNLATVPPVAGVHRVTAWRGDELVGFGHIALHRSDHNRHVAQVHIAVRPAWRRRGIGRRLLAPLVALARDDDRTLLILDYDSLAPAGKPFLEHLGARPGSEQRISKLELAEVDPAQMARWEADAATRAADYELIQVEGAIPGPLRQGYRELFEVMNDAPRDDLEIEDFSMSDDELAQYEAAQAARGVRAFSSFARHRPSGALAGYSQLFWSPQSPHVLGQGDTAVPPAHRGHRIGRWLKAANLRFARTALPQVERVFTGNAQSNEPMLAINEAMGFRPYKGIVAYQVEVETAAEKLRR